MKPTFNSHLLEQRFYDGLRQLDPRLEVDFEPYRAYLELLVKWNHAYNLTAIRDPQAMLSGHVLTSLAILPWLKGHHCLDVGSGAGIPGLLLALARPDTEWTLLDSNGKKTRFLTQAQLELGLDNVEIVQQRIEQFAPGRLFSTIVSRAFRSLAGFYKVSRTRLADGGVILAMKPGKPDAELEEISAMAGPVDYHALTVPGMEQTPGLVVIRGQ